MASFDDARKRRQKNASKKLVSQLVSCFPKLNVPFLSSENSADFFSGGLALSNFTRVSYVEMSNETYSDYILSLPEKISDDNSSSTSLSRSSSPTYNVETRNYNVDYSSYANAYAMMTMLNHQRLISL